MAIKIVRASEMEFTPAGHEDQLNPSILKKVLLSENDFLAGPIKMINYSKIVGKVPSSAHYHESLQEIFFMISGKAKIRINNEEAVLEPGDTVVINPKDVHQMWNLAKKDSEFIAIGIAKEAGKTVIV